MLETRPSVFVNTIAGYVTTEMSRYARGMKTTFRKFD